MDGVFLFAVRDGVDPYYLAGVLNSRLMARIYLVFSQEEGRVMAQVKPTIVADLPMVPPKSGDGAMDAMASRISALSKALHTSELDDDSLSARMQELDGIVEDLFSRATTLTDSSQTSSTVKVVAQ